LSHRAPRTALTLLIALLALAATAPARAAAVATPALGWQYGPMGLSSAWSPPAGAPVIVAVLDTGVDLTHPDLAGAAWTNAGEIPGNGIDDDHDGFVDDLHGWDFVAGDADPADENGHGTHVAGVIAGRGNAAYGAWGVDRDALVMPVRVLDARARGTAARVARGLRFAVAHGARVVNLSLATPFASRTLRCALDAARRAGVLVVAAAGNWGENLAREPAYPAVLPGVLSVAATGPSGSLWAGSNYGAPVALAAPGEDIVAPALGGGYELRTGTSTAAPEVSGAAALVAAQHPGMRAAGLRRALLDSARRGRLRVGSGALDVAGALASASRRSRTA
jgi:subtilisin family serine protease